MLHLALILSYVIACFSVKPHHRECEADALKRGWPLAMIRFTRCTQFFTLYAQAWLILAISSEVHACKAIAKVTSTMVCALYYVLVGINPMLLSWDADVELVRKVTRIYPPRDRYVVVWAALHFQHLACPLYFYLVDFVTINPIEGDGLVCVYALFGYVGWTLVTWRVQGKPAYPIQQRLAAHYDLACLVFVVFGMMTTVFCSYI